MSIMNVQWEQSPFGIDEIELDAAEGYRTLASSLRRQGEVRCCIRACRTWLPCRTRKNPPRFCPDHGISISTSPTYVYKDWQRNFLLRHDLIAAVKEHKVESWRLGSESSEDALSWNIFVGLAHLGLLGEAFDLLTGCKPKEEPQLFLWGVEVWPTYRPGAWSRLVGARAEFERGVHIPTEPDIMLRVAGQALVLAEAKFGSLNGTLAKKPNQSIPDFLNRYRPLPGQIDPLDREVIMDMPSDKVLEQLCRNVVFSNYLAEGKEEAFVANLVRGIAEIDVKDRMDLHLSAENRDRFRRVAWEDLGRLPSQRCVEAAPLRHYLKTKTLNLQTAFRTAY
jgi:hypothetical protein